MHSLSQDRDQRFIKTVPREQRGQVAQELAP
jgi:hypothetical protein